MIVKKSNIAIAGDQFMIPLNRVNKVATVADRILYDASSSVVVDTLFSSGLYKRMCYPCTVQRHQGYYRLIDRMVDDISDIEYYEDYIEAEPEYRLLVTLVNMYVLLHRKTVNGGCIQADTSILGNYSMDEYALVIQIGSHTPSEEIYTVRNKKFIGKVFSILEIAELSDMLWEIQCVITGVSGRGVAYDESSICIGGIDTKDKFKDIEKIALKTLKGRPAVMVGGIK